MEPSQADFCHPYQPYAIQLEFMKNLYRCIEDKKVGIFESPTGTGKSLSLICASLTWLRDHKRHLLEPEADPTDDQTDWLTRAENAARRRELLLEHEEREQKLALIRAEEARRKQQKAGPHAAKKARLGDQDGRQPVGNDDEFMLDEYDSDPGKDVLLPQTAAGTGLSSSTQALLDKIHQPWAAEKGEPEVNETKIIICSRTHSQLTQFISELRRVRPPPGISLGAQVTGDSKLEDSLKHLPLGSRKNLCIYPKVARLSSAAAINEQCLDLQRPSVPKDQRCPYLPTKDDGERLEAFRDHAVAQIRDIEDIGKLGRAMEMCPYYASRSAIGTSEVLTLPYPLLLQKSARDALGVSIKDNVVIIDEAHNLMDAIADTFSISMHLSQLELATQQVTAYVGRFKNRLKGKNRVYVAQVIRLLTSMTDCLRRIMEKKGQQHESIVTAAELMSGKGVDQIKPHKLLQYLRQSKLAYKVEGYSEAQEQHDSSRRNTGVLTHFQNFLVILMNPDDEGRFFVSRQDHDVVVRYTLLDPREHFREIVQSARAVILAGGTMSPMSDYTNYLFSYLETDHLRTFSFGHVIPQDHLLVRTIVQGPSAVEFDFTFEKRGSELVILELGHLLDRICRVVPDGVVVFFPSYEYLAQVVSVWKRQPNLMASLNHQKQIFEETRGVAVDELLRHYAHAIDTGKGGLMLSVVGGKLSEGINFSDKLGRAVIAVGLPFPNANGAEWKAKMQHVETVRYKQCREQGILNEAGCRAEAQAASRDFYENACMRAVNQSIGRAIRHKNDYAAILLVDRRFATERISRKLPGWIQGSINGKPRSREWVHIEHDLRHFFEGKDDAMLL